MTFLAGQTLPADDLNRMGCTLRRAAAQTLNDASTTTISWDTEDEDTDGLWSAGTPTVVTIPETGLWAVTFSVLRASVVNARSFVDITTNLSPWTIIATGVIRTALQPGENLVSNTYLIQFTAGNTFTVDVFADGSGNSTMTAALLVRRVVGGA